MKNILKFILISFFGISVLSLQAQKPLELSLDNAIVYAVNHNKRLINSKYAIDKSAQQLKETIAKGLPQLDASVDYTNYLGAKAYLVLAPGQPPAVISFNPTSNFKFSASQLLFSANYYVGIKLAKLARQMTEKSYRKDELDVKEQTMQAYYTVLVSKKILKILNENSKNAETIYNKTNNMVKVGIAEETDAKKLSVMVNSIENAKNAAKRQLELAYNLLRLNLGLESGQPIHLTSNLDEIVKQNILEATSVEPFNITNNIDYQLIKMQGEMSKKQIEMRKAAYLPTLVAIYAYTKKIKVPEFDVTPKNVLGVTLSIPIFSGGERHAQLSQAKIDYEVSKNTKSLVAQQLSLQQQQALFNYKNFLEQYKTQKLNVEVAEDVLRSIKRKYEHGIVSSLDLTNANNDYLKAQSDYTGTLLNLLNAKLALLKINNKL